jgi:hypothetical protein
MLDSSSKDTDGDWNNYKMEEERKKKDYGFCASFETGKPVKFLHYATHYQIVVEDIVLMGRWHLLKSTK